MPNISFEDRKALLLAQGELDRLKIAISYRALRGMLMPQADHYREEKKATLSIVLRSLLLVLGVTRARRLQKGATWALMAWRVYRYWSKGK